MKYWEITKIHKRLLSRWVKIHYQRVWNRLIEGLSEEDIYNEYIIPKQYKYSWIKWTTEIDNNIIDLYNSWINPTKIALEYWYWQSTIRNRLIKLWAHKKSKKVLT